MLAQNRFHWFPHAVLPEPPSQNYPNEPETAYPAHRVRFCLPPAWEYLSQSRLDMEQLPSGWISKRRHFAKIVAGVMVGRGFAVLAITFAPIFDTSVCWSESWQHC